MSPRFSSIGFTWRNWHDAQLILCLAAAALIGIAGFVVREPYYLQIVILTVLFATVGLGWVVGAGLTGLLLVGYISFFGVGAYTNAILQVRFGISPWLNFVLAAGVGAALAAIVALITLRIGLQEDYFGLFTVALSQILLVVFINWDLAGRATGLFITVVDTDFARMAFVSRAAYLWIALVLFAGTALLSWAVMRGRFGYVLAAARSNPMAAEALGINVPRARLAAITLSGAIAGTCGAFYAQFITFIDPKQVFGLGLNFEFLLAPILGGRTSIIGPLIGAGILRPVKDVLRGVFGGNADAAFLVLYGAVLVAAMLLLPRGMASLFERLHARLARRAP